MRCKRCRAVIAEGRKSCPNCGTLIRKKRGNITLSSQSGVQVNRFADGISDGLYNLKMAIRRDNRIMLLLVAVPLVIIGTILLISCGANSCACSCSCEGGHKEKFTFEKRENSFESSMQFAVGDALYYISDGSIMCRNSDESYRHIYDSLSASDLQSDGKYLYLREDNKVKRIELGKTAVSGSDMAETVLDFSSDNNYRLGYFLADGVMYYTLSDTESELSTLYSDRALLSGGYSDFGYMKGRIYYTASDSDITRNVYSMNTDGSDQKLAVSSVVKYQLGGGYIYAIVSDGDSNLLVKYDESGAELMRWDISALTGGEISSVAVNDIWLCFVTETKDGGSVVYRIEHDSPDIASIFAYSNSVELTGVSGDWYAFESITVNEDGKEDSRTYSIRNSRNGKSAM